MRRPCGDVRQACRYAHGNANLWPQQQPSHHGLRPVCYSRLPGVCLSRPRSSTLEFANVGIMRPQPVNNETKDVAHQLRSIYCLASISSAPHLPVCVCVYSLYNCVWSVRCHFSVVIVVVVVIIGMLSACALTKKYTFIKNMYHTGQDMMREVGLKHQQKTCRAAVLTCW